MSEVACRLLRGTGALLLAAAGARTGAAQAAPSVVSGSVAGPASSLLPQELNYSLTASNSAIFGYNGVNGTSDSFNISGTAGFVSGSEHHPFSFIYSGGYLFGNNGQPSSSFQNLGLSQVVQAQRWTFTGSDIFSYLPVTPRYGLSGVPGVGDIGTLPISTGQLPNDALLTNFGTRITNTASGGADYHFSGLTTLRSSGSFTKQHFLDGNGIENDTVTAGSELDHQITGKTLVGGGYTFARAIYPQSSFSFTSHSVVGVVQHTFGPRLSVNVSAGPQWTTSSNSVEIPSQLNATVTLGAVYAEELNSFSLSYTRGTSAGSGVLLGTLSDTLSAAAHRQFSKNWSGGLFGSYGHAQTLASLPGLYTGASSVSTGVQGSRRLGPFFSAYGSYAAQYQSLSQVVVADNAFNGTAHLITVGLSYAPRPIHLGRR